jgi:2,4-dienoyl-CoA reductase-like NADH-dependent reductase (Old Yellow Enzyme family)
LNQTRRLFFVGVNTGFANNGEPDRRLVEFYRRRSSPALYCAIVGNVVVPGGHLSNATTSVISRSSAWKSIASAITERGSKPGIQLATVWEGYEASRSFLAVNSREAIGQARDLVRSLLPNQVSTLLDSFEQGAALAIEAGFRHVQLHAAHGYLYNLLVDKRIFEGAEEVLDRIVKWSRAAKAVGVETSIRISLRTGDSEFDALGTEAYQDRIASLPVDFVDLSDGYYSINKQLIYPARPDVLKARWSESLSLAARHPEVQFILSGKAHDRLGQSLPPNANIGLCRSLIANPDLLVGTGRGCVNSGRCHYFSRGDRHITCSHWTSELE